MGVKGALVIAEGEHLCMKMRGVRNDSSITTIAHRGVIEKKEYANRSWRLSITPSLKYLGYKDHYLLLQKPSIACIYAASHT